MSSWLQLVGRSDSINNVALAAVFWPNEAGRGAPLPGIGGASPCARARAHRKSCLSLGKDEARPLRMESASARDGDNNNDCSSSLEETKAA